MGRRPLAGRSHLSSAVAHLRRRRSWTTSNRKLTQRRGKYQVGTAWLRDYLPPLAPSSKYDEDVLFVLSAVPFTHSAARPTRRWLPLPPPGQVTIEVCAPAQARCGMPSRLSPGRGRPKAGSSLGARSSYRAAASSQPPPPTHVVSAGFQARSTLLNATVTPRAADYLSMPHGTGKRRAEGATGSGRSPHRGTLLPSKPTTWLPCTAYGSTLRRKTP